MSMPPQPRSGSYTLYVVHLPLLTLIAGLFVKQYPLCQNPA
jgi:hypothetical protein